MVEMSQYKVKKPAHNINCEVEVPGSKSITNRALLMAALSDGECCLNGVLFSDDSRYFLSSLISLGYIIEASEIEKYAIIHGHGGGIPNKSATINVGSAGTAARFLTAMLALSDGKYFIDASQQMKKRPMKPLFDALESMGAQFEFTEKEGHLPVNVTGAAFGGRKPTKEVSIDISESTQFLKMMAQFGCAVSFDGKTYVIEAGSKYQPETYQIEPDVSAACYFYAAAAITGGSVLVRSVHSTSMQGDMRFLNVLEKMGCDVKEEQRGIRVTAPADGTLHGIEIDMNDFSDQSMTLAAIAPFAKEPVYIKNIGHIRLQESDRIHAIVTELARLGVRVEEEQDAVKIYPSDVKPAVVQTYDDHRMAMSFALIGLKVDGIVIDNYECCKKTFENYFKVLESIEE